MISKTLKHLGLPQMPLPSCDSLYTMMLHDDPRNDHTNHSNHYKTLSLWIVCDNPYIWFSLGFCILQWEPRLETWIRDWGLVPALPHHSLEGCILDCTWGNWSPLALAFRILLQVHQCILCRRCAGMAVHVDQCSYEDRLLASCWKHRTMFCFCSHKIDKSLPQVLHHRLPIIIMTSVKQYLHSAYKTETYNCM